MTSDTAPYQIGGGLGVACCIAIAFVIGVVRTLWVRLFPSRARAELDFAPTARRPAPVERS